MANVTPNAVTEVVPGAWTATGIVAALDAFFNGGGAVTFTRQYTGADAFVIKSSIDITPQYSIRATGASTIALEIEPSGSLTDAGNASTRPTGASADNSGSQTLTLGTMGAGSRVWVIEHDDCVTVLIKSTAGTSWQPSFQIGRIYVSDCPEVDEPLGRDGLGMFIGAPLFSTGSQTPDTWIEGIMPATGSLLHVKTGQWEGPDFFSVSATSESGADNAANLGFLRATMLPALPDTVTNVTIGRYKYIWRLGASQAPLTRWDVNNATDLCWIVGGGGGSTLANVFVIPWLRGVVP